MKFSAQFALVAALFDLWGHLGHGVDADHVGMSAVVTFVVMLLAMEFLVERKNGAERENAERQDDERQGG